MGPDIQGQIRIHLVVNLDSASYKAMDAVVTKYCSKPINDSIVVVSMQRPTINKGESSLVPTLAVQA